MSAWAYISGLLEDNTVRLTRHYALCKQVSGDPLNASVLAKARHKSDLPTYRGLGTRTDEKNVAGFQNYSIYKQKMGKEFQSLSLMLQYNNIM